MIPSCVFSNLFLHLHGQQFEIIILKKNEA